MRGAGFVFAITLATLAAPASAAPAPAIPLPHAGDVVVYAITTPVGEATALELAWEGLAPRMDRFGVERPADVATGRSAGARFELAYEPGDATLRARTLESPATRTDGTPAMPETSLVLVRERAFAPSGELESCLARARWQGMTMRALEGADLYALCPAARPADALVEAPLRDAGEVAWGDVSARAFEADLAGGATVARFAFVPDVPFPVAARFASADTSVDYELRRFERGDGPAPAPAAVTARDARADAAFAPPGRWGVVEGDPAAYLFPPSEAISAIENAPFGYRQYAAEHRDARVVAFRYFENEHTSPAGSGAIPAWTFLLNDATGQGYEITVRRAPVARPSGLPDLDAGGLAHEVEPARVTLPPLDPATLPARAMSVPDMIEAWRELAGADAPHPNRIAVRLQPDLPEGDEPGVPGRDAFVGYVSFGADVSVADPSAPSWDENSFESGLVIQVADGAAVRAFERRSDGSTWLAPLAPELATTAPVASPLARAAGDPAFLLPVAAGATLLAVLARFAGEIGQLFARHVLAPLYTRLPTESVMRNPRRARILALVTSEPGVHLNALRDATGLGGGALAYHLSVLERTGRVSRVKASGYVRFFPAGALDASAMRARAALLAGSHARIVEAVTARPGISQQELAAALGVSRVAIHRAASRLESAGLVRRERAGRARVLWPAQSNRSSR